jgi:hypothetical protein
VARVLLLACLTLMVVFISGCSRERIEVGVPLLDDFQSLESPASVATRFEAQGLSWIVLEDTRLPDSDARPPYSLLRWSVPRYEAAAVVGHLELVFFNGRLGRVEFSPESAAVFREAIAAGLPEPGGRAQDGARLVESITRAGALEIFRWDDVRVMRELREWIRHYS